MRIIEFKDVDGLQVAARSDTILRVAAYEAESRFAGQFGVFVGPSVYVVSPETAARVLEEWKQAEG